MKARLSQGTPRFPGFGRARRDPHSNISDRDGLTSQDRLGCDHSLPELDRVRCLAPCLPAAVGGQFQAISTTILGISAFYHDSTDISDEHQRLRTYKKVADVNTAEDAERILSELADRYGPPPEAVTTLLKFSLLKSRAQRLGIEAIDRRQGALNVKFHKDSRIDPDKLRAVGRMAGFTYVRTTDRFELERPK